jgi:hypothetical protein
MGIYADPALLEWFRVEYAKQSNGRLDMGKSCIRFKKPDQIPMKLIGALASKVTPKKWIEVYERNMRHRPARADALAAAEASLKGR